MLFRSKTPPKGRASEGKGKARAASGSFPSNSAGAKTAPGALGKPGGSGAHVSSRGKSGDSSNSNHANGANRTNGVTPPTAGSLKVLKGCKIFVDVKSDNGDDGAPLFVEMLEGLGAKVLGSVGSTCTHIVYKNGMQSTLTRYRYAFLPFSLPRLQVLTSTITQGPTKTLNRLLSVSLGW